VLLAAVPVLAWAGLTHAQQFSNTVDESQVVHSSLYSSGKNVDVKGEIFGDVFCVGQNVRISAKVHGDVLCAGMDVTIEGTVDGDIRAAGQNVSVAANTAKSVSLAGSDVSLDADAKVGQDLSAAGTKVNIKGEVGRDVTATGSTLVLNGTVGRNARLSGGSVALKDGANVAGDLTYTSTKKAEFANGATVAGKTEQLAPPAKKGYQFNLKFYLFLVTGMILTLLALAALFPRFMRRTSDHVKKAFFKSFAIGALSVLIWAAVMAGLVFTLVGIPLAIMLLLAFLLASALSAPIAAYYVGRLVFNDRANPLLIGAVGAVIVVSLYFLPWLGFLFVIAALGVGFGAIVLELKNYVGKNEGNVQTAAASEVQAAKPKKGKKD
jgi:cytoskeletal protein CcmA (bactofilin family)